MGQINAKFRSTVRGPSFWCPGCKQMHVLLTDAGWAFNGDYDRPTFTPSFLITGIKCNEGPNGGWDGTWPRDEYGNAIPYRCHFILTDGILNFCIDSDHELAGQAVPIPDLPQALADRS